MSAKIINPAILLDHLTLDKDPEAPALLTRNGLLSYKMLNHRIGSMAFWLTRLGFDRGDRVAAWLPKSEWACLLPLAAARAGLVYVPINPVLKPGQVTHILNDSGSKLVIANTARIKSLDDEHIPNGCEIIDEKVAIFEAGESSDLLEPNYQNTETDCLVEILYTSGSTGKPKGVMLSHANLTLGALSVCDYLNLSAEDRTLCVLPLSFDYGQNQLFSTWAAGGCAVTMDYLTARDVIKACAREQITTLAAVPPLWVQIVEQEWSDEAVRPMRRLTNSGGALTPVLVKELRAIFGAKTDIVAMYGLTEAFRSTYLEPSLIDEKPTSMGTAIPFAEVMVVRDDGKIAEPSEEGELVHAGPLVAQGYWRDDKKTAERFKLAPSESKYGGMAVWSGDTVRRGPDGLLYFVGRTDNMIKSSGNRISPTEIEEAAVASGLIAEAVAIGIPHERLGHAIKLFARPLNNDRVAEDIKENLSRYMKRNLPNFMHPADIVILKQFPKNPNGKLDRNALAQV